MKLFGSAILIIVSSVVDYASVKAIGTSIDNSSIGDERQRLRGNLRGLQHDLPQAQHSINDSRELQSIDSFFPSIASYYGGGGGRTFDHADALDAGRITRVQTWTTLRKGKIVIGGIRVVYANGLALLEGDTHGIFQELRLDADEGIIRVAGRTGSVVYSLAFYTNKGRHVTMGGNGGSRFDTRDFPDGSVLRYLRGRDGSVIDALAFATGKQPEVSGDVEVTVRSNFVSFGGNGGSDFDDVSQIGPEDIVKILSITVYHGSRIDGLKINYLTRDGSTVEKMHGNKNKNYDKVDFSDHALKNVFLRTGSRIDQITFEDTLGRAFGPFGGRGGGARSLKSGNNEVILGFFGRSGSEMDRLGVYYQANAIDRVEISGDFELSLIEADVNDSQNFGDLAVSKVTLENCDPDATTSITGGISFSEEISQSESFSQSTTTQVGYELSTTVGFETEGFGITASLETTFTIGTSLENTREFGEESTESQMFSFDTGFEAQPGERVTAEAVYLRLNYQASFTVPVNVYYLADPETPVADTFEGILEGTKVAHGRVESNVEVCDEILP